MRKDWDNYFMELAFMTAERGTCLRKKVGAVIVKDNRIVSTGYNGAPSKLAHCIDEGCVINDGHCIRTIHAEINAITDASPIERKGATLYVTDFPCEYCEKIIINSGIIEVIYSRSHDVSYNWFESAKWIKVRQFNR